MNKLPMFCLIAVLAAPLHAQVCSGGAFGGMDATGNECSDADTIRSYVDGSNIASSGPTAKMSGIERSTVTTVQARTPTKMSAVPVALITSGSAAPVMSIQSAQGISRIIKAPLPPSEPVKTSKIETPVSASCSGGADGGMDATGNQCNETPVIVNTARIVVANP